MSTAKGPAKLEKRAIGAPAVARNYFNAYQIENANDFAWDVNVYRVEFADRMRQTHENRGELKEIFWSLWKQHRNEWRGTIFVLDLNIHDVAVPGHWKLPGPVETPDYRITLQRSFRAQATDREGRKIVAGVLRDSIKKHFKNNGSLDLGDLWQDFDCFCQTPAADSTGEYLACRRFGLQVKPLTGGVLALQCSVGTTTVDGMRFSDYCNAGDLATLVRMIEDKRAGRVSRQNRPVAVRVLQQYTGPSPQTRVLDFDEIDVLSEYALHDVGRQNELLARTLRCKQFPDRVVDALPTELRLILGSQNTQEDHGETILEPEERWEWMRKIRNFVDGALIEDRKLVLATQPIEADRFPHRFVLPPVVRVRGEKGKEVHLSAPRFATEGDLQQRARSRIDHIRRNGFLIGRPISPALAWPAHLGENRGLRLKKDLDLIWEQQGIDARFALICYRNVTEIRSFMEKGKHDTLVAVLPEGSDNSHCDGDTHEAIKRAIREPSQCLHHDRTLPARLVSESWNRILQSDGRRARRIQTTYALCLGNLLVKHHWFPFAPRDPFHYNVHIGLDVGGVHNTQVMACLGYGFRRPQDSLLFLPKAIPVEIQKREPIPTDSLYKGLLALFEDVRVELREAGDTPDFNSVLFHRDGQLLGEGDIWNEKDAISRLNREFLHRGWIDHGALWTAAEYLKGAEQWRVMRLAEQQPRNPLVGYVSFPFEDQESLLVATTGSPYLTQGTAQPLLVRLSDISGQFRREQVVRDIVWQADMCFTKPDMGMRLPWVLNVADSGALQLARSYKISGITV